MMTHIAYLGSACIPFLSILDHFFALARIVSFDLLVAVIMMYMLMLAFLMDNMFLCSKYV